jgi:hypothetical protein
MDLIKELYSKLVKRTQWYAMYEVTNCDIKEYIITISSEHAIGFFDCIHTNDIKRINGQSGTTFRSIDDDDIVQIDGDSMKVYQWIQKYHTNGRKDMIYLLPSIMHCMKM